jgi:hypothetical protein
MHIILYYRMRISTKKRAAKERAAAQRRREVSAQLFDDGVRACLDEGGVGYAVIHHSPGSTYVARRHADLMKTLLEASGLQKVFQHSSGKRSLASLQPILTSRKLQVKTTSNARRGGWTWILRAGPQTSSRD